MTQLTRSDRMDDRALEELIEESQELHRDAMAVGRETPPDLADFGSTTPIVPHLGTPFCSRCSSNRQVVRDLADLSSARFGGVT